MYLAVATLLPYVLAYVLGCWIASFCQEKMRRSCQKERQRVEDELPALRERRFQEYLQWRYPTRQSSPRAVTAPLARLARLPSVTPEALPAPPWAWPPPQWLPSRRA